MSRLFLFCFFVPLFYRDVNAFSRGPPDSVCTSMQPNPNNHGNAQTSESPYMIQVNESYYNYDRNDTIKVYVKASGGRKIAGFLIQAREKGKNVPLGSFTEIPKKTKHLDCTGDAKAETAVGMKYVH